MLLSNCDRKYRLVLLIYLYNQLFCLNPNFSLVLLTFSLNSYLKLFFISQLCQKNYVIFCLFGNLFISLLFFKGLFIFLDIRHLVENISWLLSAAQRFMKLFFFLFSEPPRHLTDARSHQYSQTGKAETVPREAPRKSGILDSLFFLFFLKERLLLHISLCQSFLLFSETEHSALHCFCLGPTSHYISTTIFSTLR